MKLFSMCELQAAFSSAWNNRTTTFSIFYIEVNLHTEEGRDSEYDHALVDSQTRVACLLSTVLISFSVLLHFAAAKAVTLALVLSVVTSNNQRISSQDQTQAYSLKLFASPLC